MDERQSPPPYLESQRRASSAASRSFGDVAVADALRCSTPVPPDAASPRSPRRLARHRAVGRGYQPAGRGRGVRAHREGSGERLPDAAAAARRPARSSRYSSVAERTACPTSRGKARPDLGRRVGVGEADLVQRHGAAELAADRGGDEMRRGALRHHALGHPARHRRLVVAKRQTALRAEVVDPPGEPGVADSREGENGAELFVRPALLPGHAPPLDTPTAAALA